MKLKGIKILTSILLIASVLMPFNIFAESVSGNGPIIGVNVSITDIDHEVYNNTGTITLSTNMTRWQCDQVLNGACALYISKSSSGGTNDDITGSINLPAIVSDNYIYTYDFVFDDDYVGSITFTNSFGATTVKTYYVNGSHLTLSSNSRSSSFSISSYSLARKNNDTLIWQFPIESFNFCGQMLDLNQNRLSGFDGSQYYTFPIFDLQMGDQIFKWRLGAGARLIMIFYADAIINNATSIANYLTFSDPNIQMNFLDTIQFSHYTLNNRRGRMCKYEIINNGSSQSDFTITAAQSFTMMPVYCNQDNNLSVSTDFALTFGLSNSLLDNIQIIANGTAGSQQAESDLDSGTDSMQQSIDDIVNIENSYTNDFNSSLENIDFSDPIQSNQGILPAANFVISVFNGLILNNPLSLLIIIVCVLTIGKRVIGK